MPPLQISPVAYFDFDPALLCWVSNSFAIASIIQLTSNVFFIFISFIQLRFIDTDKRVIAHSDLNLIYGIDHSIRKRIKGHDEWHCHQISILEPGLPPVDLYMNFEKSRLKNHVPQTGFLACKNQFRNWFLLATQAVKIQFEID